MIVTVNGVKKKLRAGATLKTAIAREPYQKGTLVAVYLSEERVVSKTSDFRFETERGSFVIHLNDTPEAQMWRTQLMDKMAGINTKWVTHEIVAFGSFPTDLETDRGTYRYKMYDCFLSLGGFDNYTTYLTIARDNHSGSYGAGQGLIGRVTVGRHILDDLKEGERILSVRPVMSETSTKNVKVTDDLGMKLEDGYRVETNVRVVLDRDSPESAEHVLILSSGGVMDVSEATGSFIACSEDMDVTLPAEDSKVRDVGSVTIRNDGNGAGRLYMYRQRRQMSPFHNAAGQVVMGMAILAHAGAGSKVTVVTDPPRALAVGMTQAEGERFLREAGIRAVRTGDTSDDTIIAEQTPENTVNALKSGEV